jgi:hypothetical protein
MQSISSCALTTLVSEPKISAEGIYLSFSNFMAYVITFAHLGKVKPDNYHTPLFTDISFRLLILFRITIIPP